MKPSQTIIIQLVDPSGLPIRIADIYVGLSLYTRGNYRYSFRFGPTDAEGTLRIAYQDVERERTSSAKECLMDYNTPLENCDDRVTIDVPASEELKRAFDVATRWTGRGTTPEYARGWLTAKNGRIKAPEVSVDLKNDDTVVPVQCVNISSKEAAG